MERTAVRAAAAALGLMSLAWALDAALGLGLFAVHDLKHHHLPWRSWAASEWLAGRVPLWSPGVGQGFPMLAEGQSGVLYPPTMLLFMVLPPGLALNWSILVHIWWAGLGTWLFLRAWGRSPAGSMLGAVAFAFSGFMASHALYLGMHNSVAWLPWLLWALVRQRWLCSALAAWMMLVAGHPQAAVIGLLLGGAVAIYQSWMAPSARSLAERLPWRFGLAMLLALAGASSQILASLELSSLGMRGGGVADAFAHIGGLPPQELIGLVLPEFFGIDRPGDITETYYHRGDGYWGAGVNHWEMCAFIGVPVACLALIGARKERFWLAILLGSVVLMLGGLTPAWDLLRRLPGLGFFRFPVRFSLCLTLAVSVLASAGLDALLVMEREESRRWARRLAGLAGLAVLSLGLLGAGLKVNEGAVRSKLEAHFMAQVEVPDPPMELDPLQAAALPDPEPEDPAEIPAKIDRIVDSLERSTMPYSPRVVLPLFMVLGVVFLIWRRDELGYRRVAIGLVGLAYLDLWLFGSSYLERVKPDEAGLESETIAALGEEPDAWRSTVVDRRQDPALDGALMSASLGLLHGTRDVIITSPLMILRSEALLAEVGLDVGDKGEVKLERLGAHPELIDLLGLRWLLSVHDLTPLGYSRINDPESAVGVFENVDPLPSGFLVGCARQVESPLEALLTLDPRESAIVETETSLPDCDSGARVGRVQTVEVSPTELRFEVESDTASLLVDNRTWYPGWEAQLDGKSVPVIRADLAFRGVEVPEGRHRIVMRYQPTWAPVATLCTSFGLLGGLGWGLAGWRSRRRHESR